MKPPLVAQVHDRNHHEIRIVSSWLPTPMSVETAGCFPGECADGGPPQSPAPPDKASGTWCGRLPAARNSSSPNAAHAAHRRRRHAPAPSCEWDWPLCRTSPEALAPPPTLALLRED